MNDITPTDELLSTTSTDELLHTARELVILTKRNDWDDYDNMWDALHTLAQTFDELDRRMSNHGSALPGAWASPDGETAS